MFNLIENHFDADTETDPDTEGDRYCDTASSPGMTTWEDGNEEMTNSPKRATMLRDDKAVALNAILVACRRAAEHHEQAAALAESPEWTAKFDRLARRRHADAERIQSLVDRLGYLPDEPDKDRQDVSHLITLTRSAIAGDEEPLREKACELEDAVEEKVGAALEIEWPPEVLALLGTLTGTGRTHRKEIQNSA